MPKEGEPQPHGWYIAKRYDNPDEALAAYRRAGDLLFDQDLDATSFRIFYKEHAFVTLIGEAPLSSAAKAAVDDALADGSSAELPPEVVQQLAQRRADVTGAGFSFIELQHRPGLGIELPDG
jgi:hypothetical protein